MTRASPIIRSFNSGLFSPLLEGRTDVDPYVASLRALSNFVLTPQGPILRRSGSMMSVPVADEARKSALLPFIFANEQSQVLEFAHQKIRFVDEDGLTIFAPIAITAIGGVLAGQFDLTAAGHACVVGDQVALIGFPASTNLNGGIVKVLAVAGNVLTVTWPHFLPVLGLVFSAGMQMAKVFSVTTVYQEADLEKIRYVQSLDVVYLFCDGYEPRKLTRFSAYDWQVIDFVFTDGPFMTINDTGTRMTPAGTGGVITAGGTVTGYLGAGVPANAFDGDLTTDWVSTTNQVGVVGIHFAAGTVVAGYTIYASRASSDPTYSALDYAPANWTFEGSPDGVTWTVLDTVSGFGDYTNGKTPHFLTGNTTAYPYYRVNITACRVNGAIPPKVALISFSGPGAASAVLTASSTVNINRGVGFAATDVGRLVRLRSGDGIWRSMKITAWTSATVVNVVAQGEPLPELSPTTDWRLGYFSTTTGWPTVAAFFDDRLFVAATREFPDLIAGSVNGLYEKFSQTDETGAVLDDSALVLVLNARKLAKIVWLNTDERGLIIGTGAAEFVITSTDKDSAITARSRKARSSTNRGSADMDAVKVDRQILFVQRSGQTLRECFFDFNVDGYRSPSLSLYASHVGRTLFKEIDFAAEPYAIIWLRRGDGSLAGFTYNKEENVKGWHEHALGGSGFIENFVVIPAADGKVDTLWMSVLRTINGHTRRYIEWFTHFWDFTSTLDTAHFVDCALRYSGVPTKTVYGLPHLEGLEVDGLIDGAPFPSQVVVDGKIEFPSEGSNIIVGLGFESYAEISRIDAGATTGTSQGKIKRINEIVLRIWQSGGGEIVYPPTENVPNGEVQALAHRRPSDPTSLPVPLRTEDHGPLPFPGDYDDGGVVGIRQPKHLALPFNVVALMPDMVTAE